MKEKSVDGKRKKNIKLCEYDHAVQIHIILMKSNILYVTINIVLYKPAQKKEKRWEKKKFMVDVFR